LDQSPKRSDWVWGLLMISTGAAFLAASVGLIALAPSVSQPPRTILFLVSIIAITGGSLILIRGQTRGRDGLAGFMMLAFAAVGGWAAVWGPAQRISGGLPFLPPETNVVLARILFGAGALFCLALSAYAIRRSLNAKQ